MRIIVVDNNQFVDCIDDVIQVQFFVNDKLVIEKSDLKLSFIPLANISSIGCQDVADYKNKEENIKLKQQLAEKEKEIKALKYLSGCPNDINEMVRKVVYRDEQLCKQYDFFQK